MLRARSVLGENIDRVAQDLAELAGEIVGLELLAGVPADHSGGDDDPAPGGDPVRIALGARPARGEQRLHDWNSARWLRAITTFCTSEAPS